MDQFVFGSNTASYGSCSAVLNGQMFVIGGAYEERQLSVVESCGLKRIGDLPADMDCGTCNTYPDQNSFFILLCFSRNTPTECHRFDASHLKRLTSQLSEQTSKIRYYHK